MMSGLGNSGEKTDPDESWQNRRYCEPTSRTVARTILIDHGQGNGSRKRTVTRSHGSERIILNIGLKFSEGLTVAAT
jgi:hypothetical protein